MKIAVVKIGARIAVDNNSKSAGTGETLSVIKLFTDAGFEVDAYSKVLASDAIPDNFKLYDIETEYQNINSRNYAALIVINGNANFFGGTENKTNAILPITVMNQFKGKVFYVLCDPFLIPKQIWKSVEKKPWANKYRKEDLLITRDDITVITQVRDLDVIAAEIKREIPLNDICFFPFERFPLVTLTNLEKPDSYNVDLIYDGTFRSGRREKDMIKFYFDYPEDISVEMFGQIKLEQFDSKKIKGLKAPVFGPALKYNDFKHKMRTSMSSVAIGDDKYKKIGILGMRIFESIRIGNVIFIDSAYDNRRLTFKDKTLLGFNYVDNRKDVIDKIRYLKSNPSFIDEIVDRQRKDTDMDIPEYLSGLKAIIEQRIR